MPHLPNTDLVAVAWLRTLEGVPANGVATSLPADSSAWGQHGFIQAQSVPGGLADAYVPIHTPAVQIDCWAVNPGSQKAPWGKAGHLAELVLLSTYGFKVVEPDLPGDFETASVLSVYPLTTPRKVLNDEAGYARYSFDLAIHWTVIR